MPFRQRMKIVGYILSVGFVLMLVAGLFSIIINGPPKPAPKLKTDQDMIHDAASSLDAYCSQNPGECAGN